MPVGPACRNSDPVTHDMAVPAGAVVPAPAGPDPQPTLVEGLPAAHVMNGAACTGATAAGPAHPPPPAPVPIAVGSPTVFIGGLPAARWVPSTDTAGCGVFLGLPALAAARTTLIGDGGGAVAPLPVRMVQYGNQWVMRIGNSINVFGDPAYQGRVAEAYQRLNQLSPTLRRALAALDASPYSVVVTMYTGSAGTFNALTRPHNPVESRPGNAGTDSTIEWDPNINGNGLRPGQPGADYEGSDVDLAHETCHAARNATAQHDPGYWAANGAETNEERNTTGLPAQTYTAPGDPYDGTPLPDTTGNPYTENGTRDDYRTAGVNAPYDPVYNPGPPAPAPPRTSYDPSGAPF
ncbi:MAG TPA: M91 family zinc metallopeptidase [Gemmataceae bacterium]|jgi:uncharacterized Zn-binding protein involved in type VI secretion